MPHPNRTMPQLYLAQISDIHISAKGDQYDLLSGRAAKFLSNIVTELNKIDSLELTLITGDLFMNAQISELEQFQQVISKLKTPYRIIPGNHDRREADIDTGLTRHEFARLFNPQIRQRPSEETAQIGYWSVTLKPEIQLIGLDSVRDKDWGGVIDKPQFEWLTQELEQHSDKLIIVAIHHPLHPLVPLDAEPFWSRFVCENGAEVMALLDKHPQVKLVLTGHHHLTKMDKIGSRIHLASPAVTIYPCAYRLIHLQQEFSKKWRLSWETHPATGVVTISEARQRMVRNWGKAFDFETDRVEQYVQQAQGSEGDRVGTTILD